MNQIAGAVIDLSKDDAGTLMLENILFDPAASWLSRALRDSGAERFFVLCRAGDRERLAACFPADTGFACSDAGGAAEQLAAFLAGLAGEAAVVTAPVFLLPPGHGAMHIHKPPRETGAFTLESSALASALSNGESLETALRTHGTEIPDGQALPFTANLQDRMTVDTIAKTVSVDRMLASGVRVMDQFNTYIGPDVQVGRGTVLLPSVILRGHTVIGENCEIGPNTMIRDCTVGDRVTVNASQMNESVVESDTTVGPFAYLRPNCHVGPNVKVGDFVELKNSTIGADTKISHLTYVGDADVGRHVNFGCGTVTVNYDGDTKFRTVIGDDAFIGCNTNLVAPVQVGGGAYTAAGSTITDDVPDDSLAIARSSQVVKKQWAAKRKRKHGK